MILQGFIVATLEDGKEVVWGWFPNEPDADAWSSNMRVIGMFVAPRQAEFAKP